MPAAPHLTVSRHAAGQFTRPVVLHVPFTYFPDEVGGTEIHVAALIRALQVRGIEGAVAAPGSCDQAYAHAGVPVYRLAITSPPDLAHAYGAPDRQVAHSFGTLLARSLGGASQCGARDGREGRVHLPHACRQLRARRNDADGLRAV
jgi:hypothetical protein